MTVNMFDLMGMGGALLCEIIVTAILLFLANKLSPNSAHYGRIILANILSLIIYTVAEGYSMVPDLTSGEPPHLFPAFIIGVLPQIVILIFGLTRAKGRVAAQETAP
jgi:hypothetical protein